LAYFGQKDPDLFWGNKEVNKTFKLRTDTIREYDDAGYKIKYSSYRFNKSA
jgi:hypothetical protein